MSFLIESQEVIDIKLVCHVCRHFKVGLDLIDEVLFWHARVPLADPQGHVQGVLNAGFVQRDVVVSEQLFSGFEVLKEVLKLLVTWTKQVFKWANPGLFLLIFVLFKHKF